MTEFKLLAERIIERNRVSIREEVENARKEAEDTLQAENARIEQDKLAQKERINRKYASERAIQENVISNEERDAVLAEKQYILNEAFEEALSRLEGLDQETFQRFVYQKLKTLEGQKEGNLAIVLGEKSAGMIDQDWLNHLDIEGYTFSLSEERVPKEAGFIAQIGGIRYNFLFSNLVREARTNILPSLSQALFD